MRNTNLTLIIGAFAIIYVVWGSTYLVNFLAIDTIPPILMSGSRFFTAGLIMYVVGWLLKLPKPTMQQWRNAALSGVLLLAIGTGGLVWAEQYVATGIAALIVAADPLLVVILLWIINKKAPQWNSWFGIFLSILGITLLVGQNSFITDRNTLWGVVVIFISILSWAFASVSIGKANLPKSSIQVAAMQMLSGGIFLLILSLIVGEYASFSWEKLSGKSIFSWFYLVVFGSIIAFSSFNYLLVRVSPEKVATNTYVNPIIAMFLGWALNHEKLTHQSLWAAGLILTGVFFINSRMNKMVLRRRVKLAPIRKIKPPGA